MKKIGATLLVFLVAVMLSACQAFNGVTNETIAPDEPMTTSVFLQLKALPIGSTADAEITKWLGTVRTAAKAADPDATHLVNAELSAVSSSDYTYTVKLTLSHVPDSTWQKTTRPFKIYVHQTTYNPLALLPDSDVFTYYIGFTSTRRHSSTNADQITTDDDGNYVYLWTNADTVAFTDVYANRTLYILIVLAVGIAVGLAVYFISRYIDCKKRQNHI